MTAAVYQKITNDILAAMDRDGMPPWVKPWSAVKTTRLWEPVNGRTGRRYSSINVMVLAEACQTQGYPVNEWWTLRQVAEVGGSIKAGERGQTVLFSKPMLVMDDGTIATGDDMPSGDDHPRWQPHRCVVRGLHRLQPRSVRRAARAAFHSPSLGICAPG
jgi:antirestriction protein ArdC